MVSLCPRTSTAYRFRMRTMPPASAASGATATGDKTLAGFPSKEIPMKTDGLPRQAPDKRKENSTNRCHSYNIDVTGRHGFAIQQLAIETVGPQQSSAKTHLLTSIVFAMPCCDGNRSFAKTGSGQPKTHQEKLNQNDLCVLFLMLFCSAGQRLAEDRREHQGPQE